MYLQHRKGKPALSAIPPEIAQFIAAAQRFTDTIETAHHYELLERLMRCAAAVANVYAAALYLPILDAPTETDEPPVAQSVNLWQGFEELTMFWQVPDAYQWDAPKVISLTDCLLDAHRDIKRGLLLYARGETESDEMLVYQALWHWRTTMEKYWASRLTDALRALHQAIGRVNGGGRDF
jgi:Domain of unknown function (DUF5063)